MSVQVPLFGRHSYLSETTELHGTSDSSALPGRAAGEDSGMCAPRRDVMPRDSHVVEAGQPEEAPAVADELRAAGYWNNVTVSEFVPNKKWVAR